MKRSCTSRKATLVCITSLSHCNTDFWKILFVSCLALAFSGGARAAPHNSAAVAGQALGYVWCAVGCAFTLCLLFAPGVCCLYHYNPRHTCPLYGNTANSPRHLWLRSVCPSAKLSPSANLHVPSRSTNFAHPREVMAGSCEFFNSTVKTFGCALLPTTLVAAAPSLNASPGSDAPASK